MGPTVVDVSRQSIVERLQKGVRCQSSSHTERDNLDRIKIGYENCRRLGDGVSFQGELGACGLLIFESRE